jgi:hypothetical protein
VYVDDVDAHCARARRAGATIRSEPEDRFTGDRTLAAADAEEHPWTFAQHLRDVPPEDMHPPAQGLETPSRAGAAGRAQAPPLPPFRRGTRLGPRRASRGIPI